MPINGHGQNMLSGANNGLLNVCVNNATSANNNAKVCKSDQMFSVAALFYFDRLSSFFNDLFVINAMEILNQI